MSQEQEQRPDGTRPTEEHSAPTPSSPGSGQQVQASTTFSALWLWKAVRRWLLAFPFSTEKNASHRLHPAISYGIAIVVEVIFAAITFSLLHIFPSSTFSGIVMILGVLCAALLCGTGPGLLACIIGAALFNFLVLPPPFAWNLSTAEDLTETTLFLLIGCIISLVTSRVEVARAEAVQQVEELVTQLQAEQETATARANELEAIFEALADSLIVYDTDGHLLHFNRAASEQFVLEEQIYEYVTQLQLRDRHGQLLPSEQWPHMRTLRGEVFKGSQAMDIVIRSLDGHDTHLSVSGAPIHDTRGQILGGVLQGHDITRRYQLENLIEEQAAQLASVLETVPDAVAAYSVNGNLLFMNRAAQAMLGTRMDFETLVRTLEDFNLCDEQGQPLSKEQWPITRILRGEVLSSVDATEETVIRGDRDRYLSITGGPLRTRDGSIVGSVTVTRDVTERHRLAQRTHNVLEALLTIAQVAVQGIQGEEAVNKESMVRIVMRRMAELTCNVLGCQRVSLIAIEPGTEILRPLAIVGLSAELEQQWWSDQMQRAYRLSDSPDPSLIQHLHNNEVSLLDRAQFPWSTWPNPYGVHLALIAPMCVNNHLLGLLSLDHADYSHHYNTEEIRLAEAVAKLAALVVDHERLLSEQTEARAGELALREANRRMNEFWASLLTKSELR